MTHLFTVLDPLTAYCSCGGWVQALDTSDEVKRPPLSPREKVSAIKLLAVAWQKHYRELLQVKEPDADS